MTAVGMWCSTSTGHSGQCSEGQTGARAPPVTHERSSRECSSASRAVETPAGRTMRARPHYYKTNALPRARAYTSGLVQARSGLRQKQETSETSEYIYIYIMYREI